RSCLLLNCQRAARRDIKKPAVYSGPQEFSSSLQRLSNPWRSLPRYQPSMRHEPIESQRSLTSVHSPHRGVKRERPPSPSTSADSRTHALEYGTVHYLNASDV